MEYFQVPVHEAPLDVLGPYPGDVPSVEDSVPEVGSRRTSFSSPGPLLLANAIP